MRTSLLHVTAALLGLALANPSFATDYFVGSGTGCTHGTIQSAIDTAASNPGFDRIRIAGNQVYTAQALEIIWQDLTLEGGYANCLSAAPTPGSKTEISGQGGSNDSVIQIYQAEGLTANLVNLSLVRGDETTTSFGGGLDVRGAGLVNLVNMEIALNFAGYGGGVYAKGEGTGRLMLNIGSNTVISDNVAFVSGGGIYIEGTATLTAISSPAGVFRNQALGNALSGGYGGGIRVFGQADATIGAAGFGNAGFLFENSAPFGGALAADSDGAVPGFAMRILIYPTVLDRPVKIENNTATSQGGAFYLKSDITQFSGRSEVILTSYDIIVQNNSAPEGAAAYLDFDSTILTNTQGSSWIAKRGVVGAPAGAVGCASINCNSLLSNSTANTTGAIVRVTEDSEFVTRSLIMAGNSGGHLVKSNDPNNTIVNQTSIVLYSALLVSNTVAQALLTTTEEAEMLLESSTIAGNVIAAGKPVLRTNDKTELYRSILWQPGTQTIDYTGGATNLFNAYILSSDISNMQPNGSNSSQDPRFKLPAIGDFSLQAASPAVDYSPTTGTPELDLLRNPTGIDISLKADLFGTRDLGALELQSAGNLAYGPGFDVDLRGWVFNSYATFSTTDSSVAPGSGSVRIFVPQPGGGFPVRSTGASQCINIPGPGTYTLTGRGLPTGTFTRGTAAIINWVMRTNAGGASGCTSGIVASAGDLGLPGNWVLPATPATISISPQQWTNNTTIEIRLDVAQGGISPSLTLTANFDEISLTGVPDSDLIFANGFE